ncbi:MAG: carboxypeptidase regulatory-like domain-containing protein [Bryobacteraceae bacterium]|jgi:protocatechuate 3,4-dioxygenase beta subunit
MRARAMFAMIAAVVVCAQERTPVKTCSIEGTVTDGRSGAPIAHATLMLTGSKPKVFASATDGAGKFLLKDLAPAKYGIAAVADGYSRQTQTAACGDVVTFALAAEAAISGRVIGDDGNAVSGVRIVLLRLAYAGGEKRLIAVNGATPKDDGSYRLDNLSDDTYYLLATVPPQAKNETELAYVPTFYPGSMDASGAAAVRIRGPGEIGGSDISLLKARSFAVRGRVVGAPDFVVKMFPADLRNPGPQFTNHDPKGRFEFDGILPGSYTLTAHPGGSATPAARLHVDVSDRDVEDVELALAPGFAVTGALKFPDPDQHAAPAAQISLRSWEDPALAFRSSVAGNQFAFSDVPPAPYQVSISKLPQQSYAKSLQVDGSDAPDWIADLSASNPHTIEVELGFDAGSVSGYVRDTSGTPVPKTLVTLVPAGTGRLTMPQFLTTNSDEHGRYMFTGVKPGVYKVFAWEKVNPGAIQNRDTLRQFDAQATEVQVQPNTPATAPVSIISASAAAAIE